VGTDTTGLAEIQGRIGLAAATVCYRKPPEHPHPAARDDAAAVIESLHRSGVITEGRWVLAGDSSGGHLALAACQRLRHTGGPMPAGLLLTAPLVDMEFADPPTAAAIKADSISDVTFWWGFKLYANGIPFDDPTLSPINAPLDGLPPVHLNVAPGICSSSTTSACVMRSNAPVSTSPASSSKMPNTPTPLA